MPVDLETEVSLFASFDFDNDGDTNPYDSCGVLFDDSFSLVEAVFHGHSVRGEKSIILSDIPGHQLVERVLKDGDDVELLGEFHKFGGLPFFKYEHEEEFLPECDNLIANSYTHLMQIAFPIGPFDALVDVDWPFGEYVFHLFGKKEADRWTYKYCWG